MAVNGILERAADIPNTSLSRHKITFLAHPACFHAPFSFSFSPNGLGYVTAGVTTGVTFRLRLPPVVAS